MKCSKAPAESQSDDIAVLVVLSKRSVPCESQIKSVCEAPAECHRRKTHNARPDAVYGYLIGTQRNIGADSESDHEPPVQQILYQPRFGYNTGVT